MTVSFAALTTAGASLAASQWSYKQQGYVNASTPTKYRCATDILTPPGSPTPPPAPPHTNCSLTPWNACWTGCPHVQKNWTDPDSCAGGKVLPIPKNPEGTGGATCNGCACNSQNTSCGGGSADFGFPCTPGWYPDPLLDVPESGIPLIQKGFTQPVYLELCIPFGQAPGNYSGQLEVAAASGSLFTVPIKVEVWDIDLPHLNDTAAFNTAFNFNSDMSAWYAKGTDPEVWWND